MPTQSDPACPQNDTRQLRETKAFGIFRGKYVAKLKLRNWTEGHHHRRVNRENQRRPPARKGGGENVAFGVTGPEDGLRKPLEGAVAQSGARPIAARFYPDAISFGVGCLKGPKLNRVVNPPKAKYSRGTDSKQVP
ncbi:hypothetical protein JTE90_002586 [Oedothorax gibbosus]|uniref:Uncharacterized protein n=1 Tax=Oedothorax gibbosus TaxID=931172 RepID=A0AAV6TF02_9ARAC|nr:hypothetical protein JTE90_002586 [Oedothorax gibbosus]